MQADYRATQNAADAVMGLVCCGFFLLIIAVNIAVLFWVAKDAKSRGMDGAMWLFLILLTGVLGLAIYLFSRPQGMLTQCHNCGNNRMESSVRCPHCGAGRRRGRARPLPDDDDEPEDDVPQFVSAQPPRQVFTCPACGARLRLPPRPAGVRQKFACSNCRNLVDPDANP